MGYQEIEGITSKGANLDFATDKNGNLGVLDIWGGWWNICGTSSRWRNVQGGELGRDNEGTDRNGYERGQLHVKCSWSVCLSG